MTEHVPSHDVDDASPLVVLIHGSLDRGTSFARVVRRLPSLRVVTYDRRGYHRSRSDRAAANPRSDVVGGHVSDVLEVIDGRPSIVVGHSFGGDVALGAAIDAPDTVLAVGAYEPPLPWTQWWPRRNNREGPGGDPAAAAEAFFRRVVSDEAWERLTENARSDRRADGPALVAEMAALRNGRAPFDVRRLSVPLVLGRGELSIPHHRRAIDALVEMVPDAEVVEIPGATHGAHLSHPDSFAAFVTRVVKRAAGRPGPAGTQRRTTR